MNMFMEAISSLADLDVLFYVGPNVAISPERTAAVEQLLESYWHCKARVFLSQRSQKTTATIPSIFPLSDRLKEWWFVHPLCYWVASPEHLAAFEKCLEHKPDAVFVHRLHSIYPVLSSRKVVQPVYFDLDDIEHRAFVRGLRQPPHWRSKFLQYLKVPSLIWLERRAIAKARKTFVCSEGDKKYLTTKFCLSNVVAIPNAINAPPSYESATTPAFLFLGTYRHEPNAVAADYMVTKIWPIIKGAIPDAKLIIAGESPERISCFQRQHDGVEFRGFVDDLDALYREIRIVCCPIQSGSGTRLKIVEAAAHGKAVVSTSLGAEGLDFVPGFEILLQDDPELFAKACIELARDASLCNKIGAAARSKSIDLYSRDSSIELIKRELVN
jgi:glycosyltransferase involved in cell wall biosynthesis